MRFCRKFPSGTQSGCSTLPIFVAATSSALFTSLMGKRVSLNKGMIVEMRQSKIYKLSVLVFALRGQKVLKLNEK